MKNSAILLTFIGLFAVAAQASVSLRNGNFFTGYTDLLYPGGFEPKIERIYNSKSDYDKGMFGPGWGFEYEAYLTVSADGSVILHEYGGGAENRFSPAVFDASELDKTVAMIAKAAQDSGTMGSQAQVDSYKLKLKSDIAFRNSEWENFKKKGKLNARQLLEGTKLQSNRFAYQYITKVPGGYLRAYETGKTEKYNEAGKLARMADKNGNFIDFSYGRDGKLEKIVDNENRRMAFHYDPKGHVSAIDGVNGKHATFEYESHGLLARSVDADGNAYTYKYDTSGTNVVPNMTEIGYSDKTTQKIAYWPLAGYNQNVKSVKDRDGTFTQYDYVLKGQQPGYTSVSVTVRPSEKLVDEKGKAVAPISVSKYEYYFKKKGDGEEWQYRLITSIDGDKTDTTYNECCGLPLVIRHNAEETTFQYDQKGHVTKKITPNEITELAYHPQVGKVTKVVRYSKKDAKQNSWSTFEYDPKGNLVFAKNSEKKGVKLFYDAQGRIRSMVDQDRRRIDFKYNENSKPIEITDPSLGTITVAYKQSGEISKVESTAGRKIALQVTSAFQNLLDIIRPAGVSLSF